MAFVNNVTQPKFVIDEHRFTPVAVNVTFNPIGEMRPDFVQIINPDQSKENFKILGVKPPKNTFGGLEYVCRINSYGYEKEIKLTFFFHQMLWCIEK